LQSTAFSKKNIYIKRTTKQKSFRNSWIEREDACDHRQPLLQGSPVPTFATDGSKVGRLPVSPKQK
jgi:ribosomal protein L20